MSKIDRDIINNFLDSEKKSEWREIYLPYLSRQLGYPILINGADSEKAIGKRISTNVLGQTFYKQTDEGEWYVKGIVIKWLKKYDFIEIYATLFHEIYHAQTVSSFKDRRDEPLERNINELEAEMFSKQALGFFRDEESMDNVIKGTVDYIRERVGRKELDRIISESLQKAILEFDDFLDQIGY